jgi:hypothetical protein
MTWCLVKPRGSFTITTLLYNLKQGAGPRKTCFTDPFIKLTKTAVEWHRNCIYFIFLLTTITLAFEVTYLYIAFRFQ